MNFDNFFQIFFLENYLIALKKCSTHQQSRGENILIINYHGFVDTVLFLLGWPLPASLTGGFLFKVFRTFKKNVSNCSCSCTNQNLITSLIYYIHCKQIGSQNDEYHSECFQKIFHFKFYFDFLTLMKVGVFLIPFCRKRLILASKL